MRLEALNNTSSTYLGGTKKNKAQVVSELHADGKLTDEEVEQLEENDVITIGRITIDFSELKSNGDNSSEVLAYLNKEENYNAEIWGQNAGINPEKVSIIKGNYPMLRVRYIDNKLYKVSIEWDETNNRPIFTNVELEKNIDAIISVVNEKKQIQTSFGTFTEEISNWGTWCNMNKNGDEFYHDIENGEYLVTRKNDPNGMYIWYYNEDGLLIEIWND